MAGVNRSNVAVTDTFDTWRIRTNEVNTTLNEATDAITANTIIFRDDSSNYTANLATLNTIAVTHGTTTSAVTVTSALAAASDGTKASILTTGGIYATLDSKFAADLTIGTDLSVEGSSTLGNAITDTITFTGRVASGTHLLPIANNSTNFGSADLQFQKIFSEQNLIVATQDINANVFSVTSANGAGHTAVLKNDAAVTGTVLQVISNSNSTGTRDITKIHNSNVSATGATTLHVQTDAGRALFIDANLADGGYALQVDSEIATTNTMAVDAATTTATGALFNFPSLTTGSGIDVTSASSDLGTAGAVVEITQSSASMTSANAAVLSVNQAGEGTYGLKINSSHATANSSLRIDSVATTENVIEVVDNSLSSGDMFNMSTSAAHSGQMISLSSTATGDTARGEALLIDYRTANTTANAIRVTDGTSDTVTVSSKGDVTMAGNLDVQGTTTQITTTTTQITSSATTDNIFEVTGSSLTTGGVATFSSTGSSTGSRSLVSVIQEHASATGSTGLNVRADAGRAVFIDANLADGGYALEIDSEVATTNTMAVDAATTTATGAYFNFPSLTTGTGIDVISASSDLGSAGAVVEITQSSASMTSANAAVLSLNQAGEGTTGLKIATTHATANTALRIDSDQTTQNVIEVVADDLTSGDLLNANTNAEHTGQMFSLTSANTADSTRGEALHILYRTANTTAKAVTVANSSADIFTVEQSGDVAIGRDLSIGGNLSVQGTTTQITSSATTDNIFEVTGSSLTSGEVATFTSTGSGVGTLVSIIQEHASATGATGLNIRADAGRGVFIDTNLAAGGYALEIDADQTTGGAVKLDAATTGGASAKGAEFLFPALTTGTGIDVTSTSSNLGTAGAVVEITQSSSSMSSANAAILSVKQAGEGTYGLKIESTHASANSSLRIDSSAQTKNVIEVVDNSLSSGDMFNMSTSAAHSGQMISLTSSATADSARGEAIFVDYKSANTDANVFRITNSDAGVDTFTVSQGGDVMLKGNLHVKGTTTQINTTQTLVKDKTVILGAGSDVVENLTYSQHATAPSVTSTAHGLVSNDIIFCVAATASGVITSETLYKITRVDDDTFTLALRDGTAIDTSSDSTARTFSFIGKQEDTTVDDAGIYLPGNTAIHTLKWDDTDNYWEVNDSFKVDSTAQFVLPKGTTAERPGAITASQAQIVTGAMRYNTSNDKYEGVTSTDGTDASGWENIATESFSIAVSIALG